MVRSETKLKICRGLWGGSAHRRVAPSLPVRQGRVPQYYDDKEDNRPLCDLLLFPILHWRTDDAGAALFATTPRGSLSFFSLKFVEKPGCLFVLKNTPRHAIATPVSKYLSTS